MLIGVWGNYFESMVTDELGHLGVMRLLICTPYARFYPG